MKANLKTAAARIIARRAYGPFRETGGTPGDRESFRMDTAARYYLWQRRKWRTAPAVALERAALAPVRAYSEYRDRQWFGDTGPGAGARFESGGTPLRWLENTAAAGLRFIGWSDEISRRYGSRSIDHTGWYCRDDCQESTLRGGVWQLTGKGRRARYVSGYIEQEGRGEMNPGSAALALWTLEIGEPGDGPDESAMLSAAIYADNIARIAADREREEDSAYQAGRRAAESIQEAESARPLALAVMASLRSLERDAGRPADVVRDSARATLQRAREALETAREERRDAWSNCPAWHESAWRDGYADAGDWNRFARPLRLSRFNGEPGNGLYPERGQ